MQDHDQEGADTARAGSKLQAIAVEHREEALTRKDVCRQRAKRHNRLHLAIGLPGVVLTAVGGTAALASASPGLAAWLPLSGGALTAAWGFLGERALCKEYWRRFDCFENVASHLELLIARDGEPTEEELRTIFNQFERCGSGKGRAPDQSMLSVGG